MGGNRKGQLRKNINLIIVFILCGLWHGSGMGFLVWGLLHGFYSVLADALDGSRLAFLVRGFVGRVVCFCCVSFAWIFFRAASLKTAIIYISDMIFAGAGLNIGETMEKAGTGKLQVIILMLAILAVFVCDLIASKDNSITPERLIKAGELKSDTCFVILATVTLIFGVYGDQAVKGFIYGGF